MNITFSVARIVNAIYRDDLFFDSYKSVLFTEPLVSQSLRTIALLLVHVDRGCRTHFAAMANRHS